MNKFKASTYQIIVQEKDIEGQTYFVGSARELPDVAVYEDNAPKAYEAMLHVIEDLHSAAIEEGRPFPSTLKSSTSEFSGRVTLRMPKTLHATLERQSQEEDISLNQYLVHLLSDGSARSEQKLHDRVAATHSYALRVARHIGSFEKDPFHQSISSPTKMTRISRLNKLFVVPSSKEDAALNGAIVMEEASYGLQ